MKKIIAISLVTIASGFSTAAISAAEFGNAAEAKAMLEKAISAVKADKSTALGQMAKGENGFRDRDLYPFCGGPDGNFTAHPSLTGKSMKDLMSKTGETGWRQTLRRGKGRQHFGSFVHVATARLSRTGTKVQLRDQDR